MGRWREIREAFSDISISTIDAFCLSLLREFPLEAGVEPGFDLADETETPRLIEASLDRALRVGRGLAATDAEVALVFADLGEWRLRSGLTALLDRRLVAWSALNRFVRGREVDVATACAHLLTALRAGLASTGAKGVRHNRPESVVVHRCSPATSRIWCAEPGPTPARLRSALDRLSDHLLTQDGEPRKRLRHKKADFRSDGGFRAAQGHRVRARPACRLRRRSVPPRSQSGSSARRPPALRHCPRRIPADAAQPLAARLSRSARADAAPARPDGGVLPQPLPPRVSLRTRARR